ELLPLVADHPYHEFVLSYTVDERRQTGVYLSLLKNLNLVDVELTAETAVVLTQNTNTPGKIQGNLATHLVELHSDSTADELHQLLVHSIPARQPMWARELQEVSPHAAAPIVV